jgi:dTDP-4-dehydrorhamnose reductase
LRIAIAGAGGLVGRALTEHCLSSGDEAFAFDHNALDIAQRNEVEERLSKCQPEAVVNCAAWTDVDGCESDPVLAHAANADGPENLAWASRNVGARFLTISTDYVFDGAKEGFYTQRDDPNPLSVYAHSKLEGERRSQLAYARTIVVRTGFIFGRGGKNFLSTVVDRARRDEKVKAISDAWGTPTYAPDLARRLRELVVRDIPGVFHVVSGGEGTTYEQFARTAFEQVGCPTSHIESVSFDVLKRPAPRPRNSKLKCLLSPALGFAPLPTWQQGLSDFLQSLDKTPRANG